MTDIIGTSSDETLSGTNKSDNLSGGAGDDILYGLNGNDILDGGEGDDYLDGGNGQDILFGNAGNDTLIGQTGIDLLFGGSGDDLIGSSTGTVTSDNGADTIYGDGYQSYQDYFDKKKTTSYGNDIITGGNGAELIYGDSGLNDDGGGSDIIHAGNGNDTVYGEGGNDTLFGESGNDTIDGGAGDDIVNGGSGADILTGGSGKDIFVFNPGDNNAINQDTITDFVAGEDNIDVTGLLGDGEVEWGYTTPTANGIWFEVVEGSTYIHVDTDGDTTTSEAVIQVNGTHHFSNQDFTGTTNQAPVNTTPSGQTLDEDSTLTLSAANGNAITVSDADANTTLTVTLSATHGTLTLAGMTGLKSLVGDGTNYVVLVGYPVDINSALDGLLYTADGDYNGPASIQIESSDGFVSDIDTIDLTINPVNDAPANTVSSAQSVDEDQPLTFSGANALTVSDSTDTNEGNSTDLLSTTVTVQHGTLTVASSSGATIVNDGSANITISGTAAQINAALNGLRYDPAANYNGGDTLTIATNDGGYNNHDVGGINILSDTKTVAISVNAVNDAPINTISDAQTVNEDQSLAFSTDNGNALRVSDSTDTSQLSSTDWLSTIVSVQHGTLTAVTLENGAQLIGNGSASVTIEGTAAQINAALNGLRYNPTANYNGGDTLTITTSDGGNTGSGGVLTDSDTVAITVSAVNDAPVNTVIGGTGLYEDETLLFNTANGNVLRVSDSSDTHEAGSTDWLSATLSVLHGSLTVAAGSGATVNNDGTGSVTVSGTAAQINAALEGLRYKPAANYNGSDTLTLTTTDGGNTGSGGALADSDTVTITVQAANDAPVNTVSGAQAVDEDGTLVFSGTNGNALHVSDATDTNEAGSIDWLSTTVSVLHGALTVTAGSGATVNNDGTASVTISGTAAQINAALEGLHYNPMANYSGGDTLTLATTDGGNTGGGALSDTDTVAIAVNAIADAPTLSVPGQLANAKIALFDNGNYVDTSNSTWAESDNLQATLRAQGHVVSTFTDYSAAGLTSVLSGKDVLVIPEQENGSLANSLTGDAITAIHNFVSSGGSMVVGADSGTNDTVLLNTLFGFAVTNASTSSMTFSKTLSATGTVFADDPASLPWDNGTYTIAKSSLPTGALSLYENGNNTAVTLIPYGQGQITFLAYDWYNAQPAGTQDGGWLNVLQSAISRVTVGNEDTAIPLNLSASLTDTDGSESLSIRIAGLPNGAVLSAGIHNPDGSWTLAPTQLSGLSITPPANFNGRMDLTVTATATESSNGSTAATTKTVTVLVNPVNDVPVAGNDSAGTDEDHSVLVYPLANDYDIDGNPLSIAGFQATTSHGATVTWNGSGFSYDPTTSASLQHLAAGQTAADSFTYRLSDGTTTSQGTVNITVNGRNDAPTAVNDSAGTDEDHAVAINVLANDYDVDGNSFWIAGYQSTSNLGASITWNGSSFVYNPTNATTLQNLSGDQSITDSFSYSITDGSISSQATANITVLGQYDSLQNGNFQDASYTSYIYSASGGDSLFSFPDGASGQFSHWNFYTNGQRNGYGSGGIKFMGSNDGQSCFLQASATEDFLQSVGEQGIKQTFYAPTSYTLKFDLMEYMDQWNFYSKSEFSAFIDGNKVISLGNHDISSTWETYSFTLSPGVHTLDFRITAIQNDDYSFFTLKETNLFGVYVDNVRLVGLNQDPIILDLDHNGIGLLPRGDSPITFDLNADGLKDKVGWTDGNDGILVLDRNGDGLITDGREMFIDVDSDTPTSCLAELAKMDANSDGLIDAQDAVFAQLQVWRDANQDGVTDDGELLGLKDLGIVSIDLHGVAQDQAINGNVIQQSGTVNYANGTTTSYYEVAFDVEFATFTADSTSAVQDAPAIVEPTTNFIGGTVGDDVLIGTDNLEVTDALYGAGGNDQLIGGLGADIFVFLPGDGVDTVQDFNAMDGDILDLSAYGLGSFEQVLSVSPQTDAGLCINLSDSDSVTLIGMTQSDLQPESIYL